MISKAEFRKEYPNVDDDITPTPFYYSPAFDFSMLEGGFKNKRVKVRYVEPSEYNGVKNEQ